jgi:hypothetical protein
MVFSSSSSLDGRDTPATHGNLVALDYRGDLSALANALNFCAISPHSGGR